MKVDINLYGAFRKFGASKITLEVPGNANCSDLRTIFYEYMRKNNAEITRELVDASVFATDQEVLVNTDTIKNDMSLAILPPVCGG